MLKAIAAEALMSAFSILDMLLPVPFASKVLLVKVSVVLAVIVPKAVPLIEELDPRSKALKASVIAAPLPAPSEKTALILPVGIVTLAPLP